MQKLLILSARHARLWDKTKRDTLTPEAQLAFFEAAASCISPKGNKLSAPCVVTADNDELLAQVECLQCQIRMFRNHMSAHDIGDVMHIVVPLDVTNSSALEKRACHVLDDSDDIGLGHF